MHFVYWSVCSAREAWRHAELLGAAATAAAVWHTKRSEPESERGGSPCQRNKIWNAAALTEEDRGTEREGSVSSPLQSVREMANRRRVIYLFIFSHAAIKMEANITGPWKESSQSFPAHTQPHTRVHTDPFIRDKHTEWIHIAHGKKLPSIFFCCIWTSINSMLIEKICEKRRHSELGLMMHQTMRDFYVGSLLFEFGSLLCCFSHQHSSEFVNLSLKKVRFVLSTHLLLVITKWHYELTNAKTGYSTEVTQTQGGGGDGGWEWGWEGAAKSS